MMIRLQTFEAFLSVVQHRSARIHLQRTIRLDTAIGPAFAVRPRHMSHVVRENLTESRLIDQLLTLGVRSRVIIGQDGEFVGELVELRGIMM